MARTHNLKIWPEFFAPIKSGDKTFEVRQDDRSYMVGDILHLEEFDPGSLGTLGSFTGQHVYRRITYKMPGGRFGIDPNTCVLGLAVMDD